MQAIEDGVPTLVAAPLPDEHKLLGTTKHVRQVLLCVPRFLSIDDIGALAQASGAHQRLVCEYLAIARRMDIDLRDDEPPHAAEMRRHGLRLAARHTHVVGCVVVNGVRYSSCGPPTFPRALLADIATRNASVLRSMCVPAAFYSLQLMEALAACVRLEQLSVEEHAHDFKSIGPDTILSILRGNQGSLTNLSVTGLRPEALAWAAAHLPLRTLCVCNSPGCDLSELGQCTTLLELRLSDHDQKANRTRRRDDWAASCAGLARALPKLTRLEYVVIGAPGVSVPAVVDIEWHISTPLLELAVESPAHAMPMVRADSIVDVRIWVASTADVVRVLGRVASVQLLVIGALTPTLGSRHLLRSAIGRGLLGGGLKVLVIADGGSSLGAVTLLSIARAYPELHVFKANIYSPSVASADLAAMLRAMPRICEVRLRISLRSRLLIAGVAQLAEAAPLVFTAESSSTPPSSSLVPVTKGADAAPIDLPHLERLELPVCDDRLLSQLACPRLQTLVLLGGRVNLGDLGLLGGFPELRCAHVRVTSKTALRTETKGAGPPLRALGLSYCHAVDKEWSASRRNGILNCADSRPNLALVGAALARFPGVEALVFYGSGLAPAVLDALAGTKCASNVGKVVLKGPASGFKSDSLQTDVLATFGELACAHPRLRAVHMRTEHEPLFAGLSSTGVVALKFTGRSDTSL